MKFKMKPIISYLVVTLFLITIMGKPVKANILNLTVPAPATESAAIVVLDAETGVVLYEKDGQTPYMPASTTKVMTAILTMENLALDEMITVGPKPPFAEGSSMGFKEGEIISVENLLYCLLLQSANDAAEVLAEAISGSTEEFAKLMTAKAKELGAKHTIFMNPSGLHFDDAINLTTAKDLALITAYAGKFDKIAEIEQVRSYMLPLTNLVTDANRWVANKNELLKQDSENYYEYVTFAKTGWTPKAGHAHTALAEKNGKKIVVSILRGESKKTYWKETISLMDWAFDHTFVTPLYTKGQEVKTITLPNGEETSLMVKDDFYYVGSTNDSPTTYLTFNNQLTAKEYAAGEVVDVAKVMMDQKEIGTVELISSQDIVLKEQESSGSQDDHDPNKGIPSTEQTDSSGPLELLTVGIGVFATFAILILMICFYNLSKRKRRKAMHHRRTLYQKKKEEERNRH